MIQLGCLLFLRNLLFYSYTFVLCSLAFLDCTIIGDEPESLGSKKIKLLRTGKFSPSSSFTLVGRMQIVRVQNEDESNPDSRASASKIYLEFSSDFNIQVSAPHTNSLTVFLSSGSSLSSPQFQVAALQSLNAYQKYAINDLSEIRNIEMGLYSHVLLHSVGTSTTVAVAMLEQIPTVDTLYI